MVRLGRGVAVAAVTMLSLLAIATRADAHALAQSSDPAAGSTLKDAPKTVTITFGETPDPRLSSIQVLDTSGRPHQQGKAGALPGQPAVLQVGVGPLSHGVYTVSWRTVSEVDGHLASGSFSFGVGVTPSATQRSQATVVRAPPPSPWAVAAHWALYAGLMLLLGGAVVWLLAGPARRLRILLAVAWLLAGGGAVGLTVQQRHAAGLNLWQLWASSLGHQFLLRAVPTAAAGVLLLVALWSQRRRSRPIAMVVVAVGAIAAMGGDVAASHAAASHSWRWAKVGFQWTHFASVGVWLGGLGALLLMLPVVAPGARGALARRFSTIAGVAFFLTAGSGVARALDEVRTWRGLWHTGFGQIVVAKVALLGVLGLLGAVNRYRSVPAAGGSHRLLRRVGATELTVVVVVLGLTGILQSLAPPVSTAAAAKPPPMLVYNAADFGTTVRVRLTVSPGTAGFNHFEARILDYDTAAPVSASGVSLRFTLRPRPDLGSSSLTLRRVRPGVYAADAANLSIDGTWSVVLLVQRNAGSVEIPFTVTTRTAPQKIDVVHSPGLPDIYNVHLAGDRSMQIYLDPGHPRVLNEFHVTVLEGNGQELATSAVVATAAPAGGSAVALTVRRLDPVGHFVADLENARAGRYHFVVTATANDGSSLRATLDIVVK